MLFGPHGLCLACAATTIHNEQLAFIYLLSLADYPELCGHIIKVITFGFLVFCLLCLNDFAGVMWIGPLLLPSNRLWVFTSNQLWVGCRSVTLFPVACFAVEGAPCVPWAKCETQVRCGAASEVRPLACLHDAGALPIWGYQGMKRCWRKTPLVSVSVTTKQVFSVVSLAGLFAAVNQWFRDIIE